MQIDLNDPKWAQGFADRVVKANRSEAKRLLRAIYSTSKARDEVQS